MFSFSRFPFGFFTRVISVYFAIIPRNSRVYFYIGGMALRTCETTTPEHFSTMRTIGKIWCVSKISSICIKAYVFCKLPKA